MVIVAIALLILIPIIKKRMAEAKVKANAEYVPMVSVEKTVEAESEQTEENPQTE